MSSKLPIGVATIERPLIILSIIYIIIFIISCTPVNLSKQDTKNTQEINISKTTIDTFFFIGSEKLSLILFEDKNKKIFQKDILFDKNIEKKDLDTLIDKFFGENIIKVEKEINLLRKGASEKINKIAIETTSELLVKLIGTEVNNSSISAIVDDLSKKNGGKYYGN